MIRMELLRTWMLFAFALIVLSPLTVGQTHTHIDNSVANIKATATRGMVIDAGSGGSRLHVFQWKPRIFHSVPPPLSYPEANEHWTARMDPGISSLADNLGAVAAHLAPLIDFARVTLAGSEGEFVDYPIFFKATGGMRELEVSKREALLGQVQTLLSDESFCPFFFKPGFARVISGEEEAIFSWAATNFLKGTLLPASHGIGEVKGVNMTYGTLDLGGSSTQIAFYLPSQDILEGLYKLQIGGQKEWNVYTKSFLQYGINSARLRHVTSVADNYFQANVKDKLASGTVSIESACLHTGYVETLQNYALPAKFSDNSGVSIQMMGPSLSNSNSNSRYNQCRDLLRPLLEKSPTSFCNKVYHNDCSVGNAYQPPLPHNSHGNFIGTSSYKYAWSFLMLPETSTLEDFDNKAVEICKYNYADLLTYYTTNNLSDDNDKMTDIIPYTCFIASYISVLLQDGYGFWKNDTVTVIDTIDGHKVGWALGAILYEINELPWVLQLSTVESHAYSFLILAGVSGFFLGICASVVIYREILADKYKSFQTYYSSPGQSQRDSQEDLGHLSHPQSAEWSDHSSRKIEKLNSKRKNVGSSYSYDKESPETSHTYTRKARSEQGMQSNPISFASTNISYEQFDDHSNIRIYTDPQIRALHKNNSKSSLMSYYYAYYQQKYGNSYNQGLTSSSDYDKKLEKKADEETALLREQSSSGKEDGYQRYQQIYTPSGSGRTGGWLNWIDIPSSTQPTNDPNGASSPKHNNGVPGASSRDGRV